jgi:hypothetical protein
MSYKGLILTSKSHFKNGYEVHKTVLYGGGNIWHTYKFEVSEQAVKVERLRRD